MKRLCFVLLPFMLVACGEQKLTANQIADKIKQAGVSISDVQAQERDPSSPLPNSYEEHIAFTIPEVAPKGGQLFTCAKKNECDALYVYFDALRAFAGPYIYQSPNGLVVVQLNSGLTPATAGKVEAVIKAIK